MAAIGATKEELVKLKEFRARVGKIYPERDEKLLPWLRARDMDLAKAEQMLRRHLIWRRNNEIETLRNWRSPKVYFPYIQFGYDKENCPLFLMPIGRWEMRSAVEAGDFVPSLRFIYQTLEMIISSINKKDIYQGSVICDFDGFGYHQITHRSVLQGMLEVLRVFESNYPEVLKVAYVINNPAVFNYLFTLVKPLLNSRTLAKVRILGSNKQKWQEVLLNHVDATQIPPFWGGSRPGRDEFCSDDWFMESLPPNFFKRNGTTFDEFGEEWNTITVPAREKVLFEYFVKPGEDCYLRWAFRTQGYDIGFAIYFGEEENFPVKYQRVDSHQERQEGSLNLDQPGKYTLEFDNAYSRTRSKTLHYSIEMTQFYSCDQNFNETDIYDDKNTDSTNM
ncbi:unnamed protein product [Allacma fusca]|uniref:SEC14-like protein 2 n=1 Tax=Allacma fusca TaxID=39272 RepID=A0A8J2PAE2_9HEXA|nr:unnamed protein product [Allacma fusca]